MFGIYSNQRLSKEECKILKDHPDDYNWYCVYVRTLFHDRRFFQVRQDIKLPQGEDDNGVILMFQGGEVIYFKTVEGDVNDEEFKSVYDLCSYLNKIFKRPIKAYVVFPSDAEVTANDIDGEEDITLVFSSLRDDDGEKIIERLENKLKNHKQFTISDSIDHMLLPYMGFKDKKVFSEKLTNYMAFVKEYAADMEE